MYGSNTFWWNASISLMALSVSDVSVFLAVSFASKRRKKDIWSVNCEMNTLSVIFSVHWAKKLSVITQLAAWVQITEIQPFSHSDSHFINTIENKLCFDPLLNSSRLKDNNQDLMRIILHHKKGFYSCANQSHFPAPLSVIRGQWELSACRPGDYKV